MKSQSFLFLGILFAIEKVSYSMNTNNGPKSLKSFVTSNKLPIGGLAVGGLALAKYSSDGPVFTEDVNLQGKTAVITGANTGLGKESAVKLSSLGADVIILCKSKEKAENAIKEINERSGSNTCRAVPLNLASLNSIDNCAKEIARITDKVDILMNNAGVMALPERQETSDGFEAHLGINHLGHFALTAKLLPLLKKSDKARIINVSSAAHLFSKLDFNNLMLKQSYDPWLAYGNSKLCNILFTRSLASRLQGTDISTYSLHPGLCRTELGRYYFGDFESAPQYVKTALLLPASLVSKSAFQGAQTQIFCAASSKLRPKDNGKYFINSHRSDPSPAALDDKNAATLWTESERLTGLQFS
mmetsp:Transcript_34664/g.35354  ORF Transcript_34664/g.35354 Transcript_34664/m.35354 type:complete len:359 (-) Transcript_34664:82-1158(-)